MDDPQHHGVRRWAAAALLAAALIAAAAFVVNHTGAGGGTACAGVGIQTSTVGDSPETALAAYVREQGGDPTEWKLDTRYRGTETRFLPTRRPTRPDFQQLSVTEISSGVWATTGAC